VLIDLPAQQVQALGRVYAFEVDQAAKRMLVEGLDAIALTQTRWEVIEAFHQARKESRPWVF
jgi:3-isopropylmalate/(R)-2-methylmalate dehydratase small subunit